MTSDAGETWRSFETPFAMPAELTAVDQLNAWVASEGSLFATDNGGRTWRELTPA